MSQKGKRGCLHIIAQSANGCLCIHVQQMVAIAIIITLTLLLLHTSKHPSNKGYLYNLVFCICAGL